ncbi:hypothetical protein RCL_jg14766.t1 [Rhizophagus clarus]|uniref:Uncharacterized protein n=1 Tax=Rhizophagus clarus TaxID=94130 RepID=A0A8H3QZ25_9GLOM|nr:hypothetical protein RCL_jg14766.t1 [Rhizophagus clarus]
MGWPKNLLASNWGSSTAMAPNGENIVVFANHMYEVTPGGRYTQIGSEWPNIVAATTNANFIYAIRPDGFIYKISTSSYTNVFKWAEAGGGWEKAKTIFAYNDHIYVVLDAIWEIRLDGTYQNVQNDNWGATRSITVIGDYAYSVHDSGKIYKINLKDWTYRILSNGWENTLQLLTLDNKLFAYDVFLTIVDTNTGEKTVVHTDNWNAKVAGCATANAMFGKSIPALLLLSSFCVAVLKKDHPISEQIICMRLVPINNSPATEILLKISLFSSTGECLPFDKKNTIRILFDTADARFRYEVQRLSDLFEHDVSVNSVKNGLYKRVFAIKKKLKLSRAPYSSDEKGFGKFRFGMLETRNCPLGYRLES